MLAFTQSQLDRLADQRLQYFIERCQAHLLQCFPIFFESYSAAELGAYIRRSIRRAEQYGLKDERSTVFVIDIGVLLGEAFAEEERFAHIVEMLQNHRIHPRDRSALAFAEAHAQAKAAQERIDG